MPDIRKLRSSELSPRLSGCLYSPFRRRALSDFVPAAPYPTSKPLCRVLFVLPELHRRTLFDTVHSSVTRCTASEYFVLLRPCRPHPKHVVYSPYTVVPSRLLRVKTDITATSEVLGCSSAELILNYVVKTTEFGGRNANRTRPAAVFTAARRAVMLCRALCRHARRGIEFRWKNNVK